MFTLVRVSLLALALVIAPNLFAQPSIGPGDVAPGRVMIRVRPEAAEAIEHAFANVDRSGKNIGEVAVTSGKAIADILELPSAVKITGLKPFIAQNSIAFPDVRRRMNPALFQQLYVAPSDVRASGIVELRRAEDRVSRWFELRYEGVAAPQAVAGIVKKSRLIEYAEPRYIRRTQFIPNDSLLGFQIDVLKGMRVPQAWDAVRCDSTMVIANVDVGVDWSHRDLAASIYENVGEKGLDQDGNDRRSNGLDDDANGYIDDWHGWDFAGPFGESSDNDTRTEDTHGTHTAGITAATTDNTTGIAGIAFGARLMPLKAADNIGTYISFGYEGIAYAANAGARIINCSWGGTQRAESENDVVQYAYAKNSIVVAASGNDGAFSDFYPASYDHVLSVGSLDTSGRRDNFTNIGIRLDVGAPGAAILSTIPGNGYTYQWGTSMAAPQVSGALALVLSKHPDLTAGQAMERIRAGARGNTDSTVGDYLGRGLIDVNRSVTATNLYSARIENVNIADASGDGLLVAGESGGVELTVRNYLSPLPSLEAKIEFINGGQHIQTATKKLIFGASNTLALIKNLEADFRFRVNDSTPPNTRVLVKVTFSDAATGYGPDIDYFTFVANPTYRDLDKNNLVVTFDSKGGIGFNDPVEHSMGSGFHWKHAPAEIPTKARSVLYQAGFMLGMDEQRLVSIAPGDWPQSSDQDFRTVTAVREVTPSSHHAAIQELYTAYTDTRAWDSNQVGVTIEQRSFAFDEATAANAVVVDYAIRRRTTSLGWIPSDETHAGIYMDWDIGPSGALNSTTYDHATRTAFMRRLEDNYPVIAVRLVAKPNVSQASFHAIQNDGSEAPFGTYDGYTRLEKWLSLSIPRDSAGPGDVAQVFGAKQLPLASQDTVHLTYVLAMGVTRADALAAVDKAEALWLSTAGVETSGDARHLSVFPNPVIDRLTVNGGFNHDDIRVIDAMGRVVLSTKTSGHESVLDLTALASGVYFVEVVQNGTVTRQQIVKL